MKLLFLVESSFNMTDIQGQEARKVGWEFVTCQRSSEINLFSRAATVSRATHGAILKSLQDN